MTFLTITDLLGLVTQDVLNMLNGNVPTTTNTNVIDAAELAAVEQVRSYINPKYDVANIFNQTGNSRNPLIVMYCMDVLLYNLHAQITPNKVPVIRAERNEAAMAWLELLARGKVNPQLPTVSITNTDGSTGTYTEVRFGGKKKEATDW